MATHLRTELVVAALNMVLEQRRPSEVIPHSDQGTQYTSIAFDQRGRQAGVCPSMGSVGDCFDNALGESFFVTLVSERLGQIVSCADDFVIVCASRRYSALSAPSPGMG